MQATKLHVAWYIEAIPINSEMQFLHPFPKN